MTKPFEQLRRQQFLSRPFYEAQLGHIESVAAEISTLYQSSPDQVEQRRTWSFYLAEDGYQRLSLMFTAGADIESLRPTLGQVVEAYERYQQALGVFEGEPKMPPLGLDQLADYERCMQLIGLCYLLHRRDLLPRIAALVDPGYRHEDTLYEDLLRYELSDRADIDEWFHEEPYTSLIRAMYEPDEQVTRSLMQQYLDDWYPAFKYLPWHDGHLGITGTEGFYFGYWAFEAGAVALLCDIDDSEIDHMVYPKDMVAWARQHAHLSAADSSGGSAGTALRCEAGHPCPQAGWWFSPAGANGRQKFELGDTMPALGGDYGATIWQWDVDQSNIDGSR